MPWTSVLLKREPWIVLEIIENDGDCVFAIRCSIYCLPLLLPEQSNALAIFSTYTSPKHPAYPPLLLMCYAVRVEKL